MEFAGRDDVADGAEVIDFGFERRGEAHGGVQDQLPVDAQDRHPVTDLEKAEEFQELVTDPDLIPNLF